MRPTILLAEDEKYIGLYFQKSLNENGYNTTLVKNSNNFDKHLKKHSYNIILSDTKIPYTNGYEIVSNNLENLTKTVIIGMSSSPIFYDKWKDIAHEFLVKNDHITDIAETVTQIYERYRKE